MVIPRVSETDEGIQEEFKVQIYDKMQRRLRDKGWMETDAINKSGIKKGIALQQWILLLPLILLILIG